MTFILSAANDPSKAHASGFGWNTETFGATSKSRCDLEWGYLSSDSAGFTTNFTKLLNTADLSKVEPLSIAVRTNEQGSVVYLSSRTGNQAFNRVDYAAMPKPGISDAEAKQKPAVCAPKEKGCSVKPTTQYRAALIFFADESTAYHVAEALRHAAKLCGPSNDSLF